MTEEYENLEDVLDFDYEIPKGQVTHSFFEDVIVRPRLEAIGYYAINFHPSEANMFGPETRIVTCLDQNGKFRSFIYN